MIKNSKNDREYGGAAFEYIIVSVFAIAVTFAGLKAVSLFLESEVESFSEKYGIELDLTDISSGFE